MKKLIFTLLLIFPLSTILAQDEEDGGGDYNWTVFTNSTGLTFASADGFSGGTLNLGAYYNISEKLQAGGSFATAFGDFEEITIANLEARYFVTGNVYLQAGLPLTEDSGDGVNIGLGNRFNIGNRIEFLPSLMYNTDAEVITIGTGFAIKL